MRQSRYDRRKCGNPPACLSSAHAYQECQALWPSNTKQHDRNHISLHMCVPHCQHYHGPAESIRWTLVKCNRTCATSLSGRVLVIRHHEMSSRPLPDLETFCILQQYGPSCLRQSGHYFGQARKFVCGSRRAQDPAPMPRTRSISHCSPDHKPRYCASSGSLPFLSSADCYP